MSFRKTAVRLPAVVVLALAAACSDHGPSTAPESAPVMGITQAPDLASLKNIPGFGGLFIDRGVPTVYLTDVGQRGNAERVLRGFTRARGTRLQVLQGRFAYRDLEGWFDRVSTEAFAEGGVVFVDLDESSNRVVVGIERGAAHADIRGLAARLGVPAEAISVRETDPIVFAATLRDQVRPVVAGLQINFGNFVCSIGFNAVSGGQNSMVTASHCTNRQGGVEGTQYFQPLASTPNSLIATEVADPAYARNVAGCPKGKKCRWSDAARAAYASGVNFTLGGIAQTTGANNGSLTIAGTLSVNGEGGEVAGDVANKIGRTTGWTRGTITNTCVTTAVSGSSIALICQNFVSAGVGGGDSGSDVFAQSGTGARLLGVLWGGNGAGTQFVYSPIANVERELGPLTTF